VSGGQGLRRFKLPQDVVLLAEGDEVPGTHDRPVRTPERRRGRLGFGRGHLRLHRGEVGILAVALADLTQCAGQRQGGVGRSALGALHQHRDIGARP
jgi:hypothetical protein